MDVVPAEELLLIKLCALVLCDHVPEIALGNRTLRFLVELLEELADGGLVRGDDAAVLEDVLVRLTERLKDPSAQGRVRLARARRGRVWLVEVFCERILLDRRRAACSQGGSIVVLQAWVDCSLSRG